MNKINSDLDLHRNDIEQLKTLGYQIEQPWQVVDLFEKLVADFFGARFAVATDCATHSLELCLRLLDQKNTLVSIPKRTYMSVPMMLEKIGQKWQFVDQKWIDFYPLSPFNIIDAAALWKENSYRSGNFMCLSFGYKKHLPIGRGGMILLDDFTSYKLLQKLVRDGRNRELTQFEDDVTEIGYHYFMTPEDAAFGIKLFYHLKKRSAKVRSAADYFDLTTQSVFKTL